ncbi:hypothetical protein [Limnoglobus roseus]|uniref:Uncharacterized protein n=1 Tax=Limnoglobus roseus TaxID=2598579 RepID=A0A5C1A3P5_9BACT|nr:hypothetical protein [Limnoglobus roseus]QEL13210.1 hypothetical protein PX52LOC_00063 [Limnoglobus roseus]
MHDERDEPIEVTGADTFIPVAEPLAMGTPDEGDPILPPGVPVPLPGGPIPIPLPPIRLPCKLDFKEGCYRLTFQPTFRIAEFHGTLRVDKHGGEGTTVSGDLYRFPSIALPAPHDADGESPLPFPIPVPFPTRLNIPVYPRNKYSSYWKVTKLTVPLFMPCRITMTVEEYAYTQPPAGSSDGSFPATPSRTLTVVLTKATPPAGFSGPFFSGTVTQGGMDRGTITLGWVSSFFRRATVEIGVLAGSVVPDPVPAAGGGTEDFANVFATAGWNVTTIRNPTPIPVPAGVTATNCWSSADLHAVMLANRSPSADLDKTWWMHLLMVPAKMGCGRGVMYDTIGVPRDGVASFSDDGYPSGDSSNFGTAENKKQRDVPRAFMRSACHEVGHGFNQQHQEITGFGEPGADNSIMTTSPSVADVLGTATTGAAGVFPDNIRLGFNEHVRHHLIHFPDPVVRPGGMSFGTGHNTVVPQTDIDRVFLDDDQLALTIESAPRVKLGQPLAVSWKLTNKLGKPIPVPTDLRREALHARITVVTPTGATRTAPPAAIISDAGSIKYLAPGEARSAKTTLFYSSKGFTFRTPGQYTLKLDITWEYRGVPLGVRAEAGVWVDYPVSDADNEIASLMLHPDVGAMVATGGQTHHRPAAAALLQEAVTRHPEHPVTKAMAKYVSGR